MQSSRWAETSSLPAGHRTLPKQPIFTVGPAPRLAQPDHRTLPQKPSFTEDSAPSTTLPDREATLQDHLTQLAVLNADLWGSQRDPIGTAFDRPWMVKHNSQPSRSSRMEMSGDARNARHLNPKEHMEPNFAGRHTSKHPAYKPQPLQPSKMAMSGDARNTLHPPHKENMDPKFSGLQAPKHLAYKPQPSQPSKMAMSGDARNTHRLPPKEKMEPQYTGLQAHKHTESTPKRLPNTYAKQTDLDLTGLQVHKHTADRSKRLPSIESRQTELTFTSPQENKHTADKSKVLSTISASWAKPDEVKSGAQEYASVDTHERSALSSVDDMNTIKAARQHCYGHDQSTREGKAGAEKALEVLHWAPGVPTEATRNSSVSSSEYVSAEEGKIQEISFTSDTVLTEAASTVPRSKTRSARRTTLARKGRTKNLLLVESSDWMQHATSIFGNRKQEEPANAVEGSRDDLVRLQTNSSISTSQAGVEEYNATITCDQADGESASSTSMANSRQSHASASDPRNSDADLRTSSIQMSQHGEGYLERQDGGKRDNELLRKQALAANEPTEPFVKCTATDNIVQQVSISDKSKQDDSLESGHKRMLSAHYQDRPTVHPQNHSSVHENEETEVFKERQRLWKEFRAGEKSRDASEEAPCTPEQVTDLNRRASECTRQWNNATRLRTASDKRAEVEVTEWRGRLQEEAAKHAEEPLWKGATAMPEVQLNKTQEGASIAYAVKKVNEYIKFHQEEIDANFRLQAQRHGIAVSPSPAETPAATSAPLSQLSPSVHSSMCKEDTSTKTANHDSLEPENTVLRADAKTFKPKSGRSKLSPSLFPEQTFTDAVQLKTLKSKDQIPKDLNGLSMPEASAPIETSKYAATSIPAALTNVYTLPLLSSVATSPCLPATTSTAPARGDLLVYSASLVESVGLGVVDLAMEMRRIRLQEIHELKMRLAALEKAEKACMESGVDGVEGEDRVTRASRKIETQEDDLIDLSHPDVSPVQPAESEALAKSQGKHVQPHDSPPARSSETANHKRLVSLARQMSATKTTRLCALRDSWQKLPKLYISVGSPNTPEEVETALFKSLRSTKTQLTSIQREIDESPWQRGVEARGEFGGLTERLAEAQYEYNEHVKDLLKIYDGELPKRLEEEFL